MSVLGIVGLGSAAALGGTIATTAACEEPSRPRMEPFEKGLLTTDDGLHRLYYEVSGNPDGKPALFLHGGPGDGSSPSHRMLFDSAVFKIVAFDQRGAGKSQPPGSLEANTTADLVADCEQLRRHLGVDVWHVVVGGSWGSTLALAYAQAHPHSTLSLVLYSIFLPSRRSIDWMYQPGGAQLLFPDAYEAFVSQLTAEERVDPVRAYRRRLSATDPAARLSAKVSLTSYVLQLLALQPPPVSKIVEEMVAKPEEVGDASLIELHYMEKNCFLQEGELLGLCNRIAHIPCAILHGRYDVLCPAFQAWDLHRALPLSTLSIVPESGHSSSRSPLLKRAIIEAVQRFA